MKKALLLLIIAFIFVNIQNGFSQKKLKSKLELKAGIGLLPTFFKDDAQTKLMPLSFGVKYQLSKKMSLEAYLGHSRSSAGTEPMGDQVPPQWQNTMTVIGLRGAAHPVTNFEKWDFYGGMMINYSITQINVQHGNPDVLWDRLGFEPNAGKMTISGFVGTNYKIWKRFGLFGELGFGASLFKTGVSLAL